MTRDQFINAKPESTICDGANIVTVILNHGYGSKRFLLVASPDGTRRTVNAAMFPDSYLSTLKYTETETYA